MSKSLKNKRGFTIIEATVSIFILIIGLTAVMQFFPFSLRIIGDSESITAASNLAINKLEETASLDYEQIGTGTIEAKQRLSADPSSYLYDYWRQTTAQFVDANLQPSANDIGMKQVIVTVYWLSSVGLNEKSISMSALVSDF